MKTYQQKGNDSLLIINHKTSRKVQIKDVIFLKGDINYSTVYLENGKTKTLAHTLKFYEEFLRIHGFLRVHRAFLINPNYITEYCQEKEIVKMKNGHEATISRRRKGEMIGYE
jgi:DNA-binding LytR/AlgR family response regulator